jgi:hypothetical protein
MINVKDLKKGVSIEDICNTLLEARVQIQLYHWAAKPAINFALHEALGALYNDIDGKLDGFVETSQGTYGKVFMLKTKPLATSNGVVATQALSYVKGLNEFLISARSSITHSHLQNEIDDFINIVNLALYKLTS